AGIVAATLIVPIVMIVFGVKYLDECPLETKIPIFLIVGGCFGIVKILVVLGKYVQNRHMGSVDNLAGEVDDDRVVQSKTYRSINSALSLFLIAWNVLGSVWVLRIWKPRFEPLLHRPDVWCHRSLYFFSVAIIVAVYAVLGLMVLVVTCLLCMYRTSGRRGSRRTRGSRT
ncbi:unnamed protein product, partial [Candidula unifasciata]